jgi:hypothetical protein
LGVVHRHVMPKHNREAFDASLDEGSGGCNSLKSEGEVTELHEKWVKT